MSVAHWKDWQLQGISLFSYAKLAFNPKAGLGTSCFVCSPGLAQQSSIMCNDWTIEQHMTRNNKKESFSLERNLSRVAFSQSEYKWNMFQQEANQGHICF